MEINTITTKEKLKEIFIFLSELFYDEALKYNEHYFTMTERYNEMLEQFNNDKELLLYIEEDNEIVAALTSKNIDKEKQKITLGVMGVSEKYRRKGYARTLINEFENKCKTKNILHIELGSRFRACSLYKSLGYKPSLMVQVYDFITIEDIRKENIFNLKEKYSHQGETYGFIFFEIQSIDEKYIKHFETNVKTAFVQYIFEKDL